MYTRANQIANTTQLDNLLSQLLAFAMELSHASAGIVYLIGQEEPLVIRACLGLPNSKALLGTTVGDEYSLACQCLLKGHSELKDLWGVEMGGQVDLNALRGFTLRNTAVFPIPERKFPTGVLQLFNLDGSEMDLVQALCDRLASDIQKLLLLQSSETVTMSENDASKMSMRQIFDTAAPGERNNRATQLAGLLVKAIDDLPLIREVMALWNRQLPKPLSLHELDVITTGVYKRYHQRKNNKRIQYDVPGF